jgi:diguanylate cyclase (GGDEF)-like protein/PAS domain S-box-containing protein
MRVPRARLAVAPSALLALAAVAVFVALTASFEGNTPAWTAFDNIGELLAAVAATVACAARARRERLLYVSLRELGDIGSPDPADLPLQRQNKLAWLLLTLGVGLWGAGQLGWSVYEVGLGLTPPSPSFLDALFLSSPVLIVAGLLTMVRTPAGYLSHLRGAVEALFIAGGCFLLSWSLIGSAVLASEASAFSQVVNLAYPCLDAVALAAVLFVAIRRGDRWPAGLGFLGLGIVFVACSDSAFWYLSSVSGGVAGATPLDSGWVAGFLLIALAAHRRRPPRHWQHRMLTSRPMIALPALPAAAGIAVMGARWLVDGSVGSQSVLLAILASLGMLGVGLVAMVSFEDRALMGNLEERVRERTAALHATERYYRALVQRSSDVMMVVDADMRIRYVSDSMGTTFGRAPATLIGLGLDALGHDAEQALSEALDRAAATPGHVSRVIWELVDGAGRTRRAESQISNLLADPNVAGFVLNTRDDTDRAALEQQLRRQAFHDPLTGLANRALLADRATQALARSRRNGTSVAVVVLDLDSFKLINDRLGHLAGDELLCSVGRRLGTAVRPGDTVARTGGDEFVVLMESVRRTEEVLALAERIREALHTPFELGRDQHTVTASIGVAVDHAPQTSFEQILSDADVAMYTVKAGGRDAVELFQPNMHQQARERFHLQTELREGLERNEFWILYQPEFVADGSHLQGFEALLRWNNPKRGLLQPERFIGLAEESGLIVPLGRWVLHESLRHAARWEAVPGESFAPQISVNVSAVQLSAPSFVGDVRTALSDSRIDPRRVVLEITESSLIDASPRISDVLHELKQLGLLIAIDDFGTGYASISYLQSIPVDILKVDKSFVTAGSDGRRGRELLEAIVNIGHVLSLQTVAEGVEQPSQLATAKQAGCDLVQGYLFSRPLPEDQVRRLIAEQSARVQSPPPTPALETDRSANVA